MEAFHLAPLVSNSNSFHTGCVRDLPLTVNCIILWLAPVVAKLTNHCFLFCICRHFGNLHSLARRPHSLFPALGGISFMHTKEDNYLEHESKYEIIIIVSPIKQGTGPKPELFILSPRSPNWGSTLPEMESETRGEKNPVSRESPDQQWLANPPETPTVPSGKVTLQQSITNLIFCQLWFPCFHSLLPMKVFHFAQLLRAPFYLRDWMLFDLK